MADKVSVGKAELGVIRNRLWNDYTDMPGRGNGLAVHLIDRALGTDSVWVDRYLADVGKGDLALTRALHAEKGQPKQD